MHKGTASVCINLKVMIPMNILNMVTRNKTVMINFRRKRGADRLTAWRNRDVYSHMIHIRSDTVVENVGSGLRRRLEF